MAWTVLTGWSVLALWLVGGTASAQTAGLVPTAPDPDPVVVVAIEDPQRLLRRGLPFARAIVRDTFRTAGVTVVWEAPPTGTADRTLTITLISSTDAPADVSLDATGVAPSPGDGTRGVRAFVFVDRVTAYAEEHGVSLSHVLACVMAHEIGHLLLPPNAHVPEGVMQRGWHPRQFPPKAAGVPGFPADQARLLRRRARRM